MKTSSCLACAALASICADRAMAEGPEGPALASALHASFQPPGDEAPDPEAGASLDADEGGEGPNRGRLTFDFGASITSAYFFRGYLQEDEGFIFQPYVEIGATLLEPDDDDDLGISIYVGNWNSFHSEQTGSTGAGQDSWYESDFYAGIGFSFDAFELGVGYTIYTYPNNDTFDEVQEIGFTLSYDTPDDSVLDAIIGDPSIGFYFETDNSNVAGEEAAYFELGLGPSFDIFDGDVSVSIPFTLGLSLDDYYGDDDFGFASVGVHFESTVYSGGFGDVSLTAGIDVLFLGDTAEAANSDDDTDVSAFFGVSVSY